MTNPPGTCEGPDCSNPLPPTQRGGAGRRRFCSARCRRKAANERAKSLTEKKCSGCKVVKPIGEFHAPYRGYCKVCESTKQRERYKEGRPYLSREKSYERNIERRYGITLAEYEAKRDAQGGRCAICGTTPEDRLHVDHDHATGAVRDLLCGPCNAGLGGARDNITTLRAMIAYLERHGITETAQEETSHG